MKNGIIRVFAAVIGLIVINLLVGLFDVQWDLTSDKRNTISTEAKQLLRTIEDDPTVFTVFLEGNVPAEFKAYRDYIDYYLSELGRNNRNIEVLYRNPNDGEDANKFKEFLRSRGVEGISRQVGSKDEVSKSLIYPYISIHDSEGLEFVDLLEAKLPQETEAEALSRSQLKLESKLLRKLRSLKSPTAKAVHIIGPQARLIAEGYNRDSRLNSRKYVASDGDDILSALDSISAIVVVTDQDIDRVSLIALDICAQRGVPIIWFVDKFQVSLDSLSETGSFLAVANVLNIEDYLFKLGVKLEPVLVSDLNASAIPQVTGETGGQAKTVLLPYPYHVLIQNDENMPTISRTGQPIHYKYPSPLTVSTVLPEVTYEVIIASSKYSRAQPSPVPLDFGVMRVQPDPEDYNTASIPLALRIAGRLPGYYNNRLTSDEKNTFLAYLPTDIEEIQSQQIIVTDASIASPSVGRNGRFYPVGYNTWDRQMYGGNIELINNLLEGVIDGEDLMRLADRDVAVGILDVPYWETYKTNMTFWILGFPILIVLLLFGLCTYLRQRKYANYKI